MTRAGGLVPLVSIEKPPTIALRLTGQGNKFFYVGIKVCVHARVLYLVLMRSHVCTFSPRLLLAAAFAAPALAR